MTPAWSPSRIVIQQLSSSRRASTSYLSLCRHPFSPSVSQCGCEGKYLCRLTMVHNMSLLCLQVMAEGELLSKKQLAQESTMKKLRQHVKDAELSRQELATDLSVERQRLEQLQTTKQKLEADLAAAKHAHRVEVETERAHYEGLLAKSRSAQVWIMCNNGLVMTGATDFIVTFLSSTYWCKLQGQANFQSNFQLESSQNSRLQSSRLQLMNHHPTFSSSSSAHINIGAAEHQASRTWQQVE